MRSYSNEEILSLVDRAPSLIQAALSDLNNIRTITAAGKKYQLRIDQIGLLADLYRNTLLGLVSPNDFYQELVRGGLNDISARAIISEINEKIFVPLRAQMKAQAQGQAPQQATLLVQNQQAARPSIPSAPPQARPSVPMPQGAARPPMPPNPSRPVASTPQAQTSHPAPQAPLPVNVAPLPPKATMPRSINRLLDDKEVPHIDLPGEEKPMLDTRFMPAPLTRAPAPSINRLAPQPPAPSIPPIKPKMPPPPPNLPGAVQVESPSPQARTAPAVSVGPKQSGPKLPTFTFNPPASTSGQVPSRPPLPEMPPITRSAPTPAPQVSQTSPPPPPAPKPIAQPVPVPPPPLMPPVPAPTPRPQVPPAPKPFEPVMLKPQAQPAPRPVQSQPAMQRPAPQPPQMFRPKPPSGLRSAPMASMGGGDPYREEIPKPQPGEIPDFANVHTLPTEEPSTAVPPKPAQSAKPYSIDPYREPIA